MSLFVDIKKKYKDFELNIKFEATNQVLSFLGASGSGKSLTLKCIAGIIKPDEGRIVLGDRVLFDSKEGVNIPIQDRRVGIMFQNYALFPSMDVYENIYCSIRKHGRSKEDNDAIVNDILHRMNLYDVKNHKISELSGGQMQRVALARILVNDADIMMLDEPLSALDDHLRFSIMRELSQVFEEFGKTVIFITHNRDEAYKLSDKIAVFNNGRIDAIGDVDEIFSNPITLAAARLTGVKNILRDFSLSDEKIVGIRMNSIKLRKKSPDDLSLSCRIENIEKTPFTYVVALKTNTSIEPLYMEIPKDSFDKKIGDSIEVFIAKKDIMPLVST